MEAGTIGQSSVGRVVVVGGLSRAGIAFRTLVATARPFALTVLVRRPDMALPGEQVVVVKDYFSPPDEALVGADAIVNFAGITENRRGSELVKVNVEGPKRLARKAQACSIKHFVQMSSLHVYGAPRHIDHTTAEAPLSAYALSKLAGDMALSTLRTEDFRVTLLRMPMHYGLNTGKKLRMLVRIMSRLGWFPVPKRPVRRSIVHLSNLATAIITIIRRQSDGVQFVADPELFDYELLRDSLCLYTGRTIRLIRVPEILLLPVRALAPGAYRRLYQNNVVAPELVLQPEGGYPITIMAGLKDLVL